MYVQAKPGFCAGNMVMDCCGRNPNQYDLQEDDKCFQPCLFDTSITDCLYLVEW